MIISTGDTQTAEGFETVLQRVRSLMEKDAVDRPAYYKSRGGELLEDDVYESMVEISRGTPFEDTIDRLGGITFPDIVARKYWGVEVKTTTQNHWRSTGNSVLESSRAPEVERIYMYFGKLSDPIGFRYRRYEECLYDIAVTHSPRYLLDMDTAVGKTIFDRISISYDDLRNSDKPIRTLVDRYRRIIPSNGDLWWLGETEIPEPNIVVKLLSDLDEEKRRQLLVQSMALFPQVFGTSSLKYGKLSAWLAGTHGVVSPHLRDYFTAGGAVELRVEGRVCSGVPRMYKHLRDNAVRVVQELERTDRADLEYYWNHRVDGSVVEKWIELVRAFSEPQVRTCGLDVEAMIREQTMRTRVSEGS